MSDVQASLATKASLKQPFPIYHSTFMLVVFSLLFTVSLVLFSILCSVMVIHPATAYELFAKNPVGGGVIVVMELGSIYLFYTRVYRPWRNFRRPVVTLSLDGIAVRDKPLMTWHNLERNHIRTIYSASGPTISILRLRGKDGQKIGVFFGDVRISDDDYFRLCELYEAEALHGVRPIAAD